MERRQPERSSSVDDRRKIQRFSENTMLSHINQIKWWSRALFLTCVAASVGQFGWGFYEGGRALGEGIFYATVFALAAVLLQRYLSAVKDYLNNHSVAQMDKMIERQLHLFTVGGVLAVVMLVMMVVLRI
jgi:hypothetical protein